MNVNYTTILGTGLLRDTKNFPWNISGTRAWLWTVSQTQILVLVDDNFKKSAPGTLLTFSFFSKQLGLTIFHKRGGSIQAPRGVLACGYHQSRWSLWALRRRASIRLHALHDFDKTGWSSNIKMPWALQPQPGYVKYPWNAEVPFLYMSIARDRTTTRYSEQMVSWHWTR